MTANEFVRNNRGINNREDLPEQYLISLYNSITSNEISITLGVGDIAKKHKEGKSVQMSARGWKKLLGGSRKSIFHTSVARSIGKEMFLLVWDSSIHIFGAYLELKEGALNHVARDIAPYFDHVGLHSLHRSVVGKSQAARVPFVDVRNVHDKLVLRIAQVLNCFGWLFALRDGCCY